MPKSFLKERLYNVKKLITIKGKMPMDTHKKTGKEQKII